MAARIPHLIQKSSGFYARLAVPKDLQTVMGKTELTMPLVAVSRAEAKEKLPAAVALLRARIDVARGQNPRRAAARLDRKGRHLSPHQLALSHYQHQVRLDDEMRAADHRFAAHGFVDDGLVRSLREAVAGALSNDDLMSLIGQHLRHYEANGNLRADFGSPEWRKGATAIAAAELEALRRQAERDEGDFSGQPVAAILAEPPQFEVPKDNLAHRVMGPESLKSLSELLPTYLSEKKASPAHNNEVTVAVRMLEEHLEEPKPVYRITRQDLNGFKRALAEAPANYIKRFPGKVLPDAISANKARATPFPLLNARTINDKYLSKLHAFFNWCVSNDIVPDNAATKVKLANVRNTEPPRINFSPDDLARIFDPARFDMTQHFDERRWAMLISLFTGTRASETAQIKLDSIRTERGILLFAIEEKTKTASSRRLIPVHKTLIDLGLDSHVARLRHNKETHLFPEWYRQGMASSARAKAGGGPARLNQYFPRYIPRWFNEQYRTVVGIQDRRKVWHSFRHTFKTGLALAGVDKAIMDELCGHADYSAGAGYVHGVSVEKLKDAINKLTFDGLSLAT